MGLAKKDLPLHEKRKALEAIYDEFANDYPEVPVITPPELRTLLSQDDPRVVLVDVRTPDEQAVSRIPGNTLGRDEFLARKEEFREHVVVAYCTVGRRSGAFADQLRRQGFNARNLKGSIVAWTQEGFPLVTGDVASPRDTKRVHTFGATWALQGEGYEAVTFPVPLVRAVGEVVREKLFAWRGK